MSMLTPSFIEVIDPGLYTLDQAEFMAKKLMDAGQRIPERCALALQGEPPPDPGRAERMLELLPRITTPERLLPLLDRIMPSSNARIRSKAWKLYARASENLTWVRDQLDDSDPRVAANVVEALWRARPSAQLEEIFELASAQERNRVAGNGLVGLFLCREAQAVVLLRKMAEHEDADFRATAAWVVGRVQWRDGVELLRKMRQDPVEKVRLNASRSLLRLAHRISGAA